MVPEKAYRPLDTESTAFLKRNGRTVKICDVLCESEKAKLLSIKELIND
jgi:hypothetical protein